MGSANQCLAFRTPGVNCRLQYFGGSPGQYTAEYSETKHVPP